MDMTEQQAMQQWAAQQLPGIDRTNRDRATRERNEQNLKRIIKDYLAVTGAPWQHGPYIFGGAVNLCTTIAEVCKELAEEQRCADWATAAEHFEALETAVDLRYEERA